MRLLTRFALGLLGLAACAVAEDDAAIELDRLRFPKFIESNSVVMVDCKSSACALAAMLEPLF